MVSSGTKVSLGASPGVQLEVTRKECGYYVAPRLNSRLFACGLRAVFVVGDRNNCHYLSVVESGEEAFFRHYLDAKNMRVVASLNSSEGLIAA